MINCKMRTKKVLKIIGMVIISIMFHSCYSTVVLTQRLSYHVSNEDGDGRTDQNRFVVEYEKFAIMYSAEGGCMVLNNSDSMMYIDMGESYFMKNYGESVRLYDNTVRTSSSTTAVSVSGTQYGYNVKGTMEVGGSNTNVEQIQEERIVTIPPYGRRNLKFYALGVTPYTEIVDGVEQTKKVGSVYNYTDEYSDCNGHVMTYSFNPQVYKKMARNNFTITKEEILSTPSTEQEYSVRQVYNLAEEYDLNKTIVAVACPIVLLVLGIVLAALQ